MGLPSFISPSIFQARLVLLRLTVWLTISISARADQIDSGPERASITPARKASVARVEPINTNLWSIRPLRCPAAPAVSDSTWLHNPIDAFILARLESVGLKPAPGADRLTLIRRVYFDLLGLPPPPDAVDRFLNDPSPDAYEKLVERLLSALHYGERWGRHWLDVVRYTESQGFEYDRLRDNAWPYRDYVIASFNSDKPYDQFVREQIAGDVLEPRTPERMVATSVLVCGPWGEAGNSQANATQRAITREEELEDLISTVTQTFLGMTVNCARCHAHKFDPIPQEDYYRIKSVFEGVRHGDGVIATPEQARRHEERLAPIKARLTDLEKRLSDLQIEMRAMVLLPRNGNLKDEEISSMAPEPMRLERTSLLAQIEKARAESSALPPLPAAYVGKRQQPAPTRRLKRGDVKSPEEEMKPGALSSIPDLSGDFDLSADAPEAKRRIQFAEWLSDARNPLTARVMVNRLWHYHFGAGIIATPNDFGNAGAGPSHPELLDWLASKFIESGWSVKALQRIIVCSATYRQSSRFVKDAAEKDAENRLLWRFSPHRLEAEAIRDAMLAASGEINFAAGGPSFQPFDIIKFNSSTYIPADKLGPAFNRRTVYRMNVNSGKEPLLDAFDCPDPSVKTPRRGVTTTPLQALMLMNNGFVQRQAEKLARRATEESGDDFDDAVRRVYQHALGRGPTDRELKRAADGADAADARRRDLSGLCWAIFNSTEFLYVQ